MKYRTGLMTARAQIRARVSVRFWSVLRLAVAWLVRFIVRSRLVWGGLSSVWVCLCMFVQILWSIDVCVRRGWTADEAGWSICVCITRSDSSTFCIVCTCAHLWRAAKWKTVLTYRPTSQSVACVVLRHDVDTHFSISGWLGGVLLTPTYRHWQQLLLNKPTCGVKVGQTYMELGYVSPALDLLRLQRLVQLKTR